MNIQAIKERINIYRKNTTPEQLLKEFEDLGTEFESTNSVFLVYGHTLKGKAVVIEVVAEHEAEALGLARELKPDCRFNHCQIKSISNE